MINYKGARLITGKTISTYFRDGRCTIHNPVSDTVLNRIREGAGKSRRLKKQYKEWMWGGLWGMKKGKALDPVNEEKEDFLVEIKKISFDALAGVLATLRCDSTERNGKEESSPDPTYRMILLIRMPVFITSLLAFLQLNHQINDKDHLIGS